MISSRAARQFTEEDFVQDGVREVLAISAVSRRGGSQGLKIDRAEEGCMRREGVVIGRVQGTKSLNGGGSGGGQCQGVRACHGATEFACMH